MKNRKMLATAIGAALVLGTIVPVTAPAMAQTQAPAEDSKFDSRAADIVALFKGEKAADQVFAASFLAAVSEDQLAQINQQLQSQFGSIVGVESVEPANANGANITLRFEKALVSGPMSLAADAPYLVDGFLLKDIQQIDDGPDKISADIEALGGSKAAWFGPLDGESIYSYGDPTKQFALGSTFKLYVLAALSRAVSEGRLSWDDVVALDAKSFPSGMMQNWPDGAPVTLHTAATLMISISDNTATDLVMKAVGREAIEAEMRGSGHTMPDKSYPFLTTREMFTIKAGPLGAEYAAASEAERRAMLETLDSDGLTLDRMIEVFTSGKPVLIEDIEWYASMRDELGLMRLLAGMPDDTARQIMAVNKAFSESEAADWAYVGYKGGSEAGVLNMSWLLRDEGGRWHMLAISQMDPTREVDTTALSMIAKRILALAE